MIVVLAVINVRGVKESTDAQRPLAVIDFLTQVLLVLVGGVLVFSPETLVDNVHLGVAPDLDGLHPRDPDRHARLHGHRDDLEHGRGGQGRDEDDPDRRSTACGSPCSRSTSRCRPSRCPRCRSPRTPNGEYQTLLGLTEEQGGYAGDPILGVVKQIDLGPLQNVGEIYVGLLAATILFLATNAGLIGVSRLVYSMGIHRQLPDRLRQLHPQVPHAVDRDPDLLGGSRSR